LSALWSVREGIGPSTGVGTDPIKRSRRGGLHHLCESGGGRRLLNRSSVQPL